MIYWLGTMILFILRQMEQPLLFMMEISSLKHCGLFSSSSYYLGSRTNLMIPKCGCRMLLCNRLPQLRAWHYKSTHDVLTHVWIMKYFGEKCTQAGCGEIFILEQTLRPEQNSPNLAENNFKCIFSEENLYILIKYFQSEVCSEHLIENKSTFG